MIEELIHFLLEETYPEFTVRRQGDPISVVHVPTAGMGAEEMHQLTGWCLQHKVNAVNLSPDGTEFMILIREGA